MSNPNGSEPPNPVQSERRSPRQKPTGVPILCGKCKQLLAYSRGATLDCFAFTVAHRIKMVCEACNWETRWGPDKQEPATTPVDTPEKPA